MKKKRFGQALAEYVLMVSLLALVVLASLTALGDSVNRGLLANISNNLEQASASISAS